MKTEKEVIIEALADNSATIPVIAKRLKISVNTLYRRMDEHGIKYRGRIHSLLGRKKKKIIVALSLALLLP